MKFKAGSKENGIDTKHFLKLKDKDSLVGIFQGDPHEFRIHWVDKKPIDCLGDNCPECIKKKASFRFRINFITKENEAFVSKIWEQGWTVYEQLRGLHEGDYPLDKTKVKITRYGQDQNTTYSILPAKGDVPPEALKEIKAVKLHDLKNLVPEEPKASTAFASDFDDPNDGNEDIPF